MAVTSDERNLALQELFERALELPPDAREVLLREQCADESLRAEVLELLAVAARDPSFLTRPLRAGETTWQRLFLELSPPLPERVGPYRLLRQIGAGGMGRVFLAEQDSPRREVAVKLLFGRVPGDAGRTSRDAQPAQAGAARQFEREIGALARLQHKGIAQILQAGVDAEGRAWFAMHRVAGRPLVDAASEQRLDARERLLLLARTCDAVEHAHVQGVVHCDLKPGNVLVGEDGQPVVLDFGIARVASPGGPLTLHANLAHVLGTLAYMSPEQAAGDRSALDARTDIYALGVMLYELLTGRMPYVTRGLPPEEAAAVVKSAAPAPLGMPGTQAPLDAQELQLIVDTALAKRPEERYASAAALAEDLRRCAERRPILARRSSAWRRARLLVRRQPVACSLLLLAGLVLLGGLIVAAVQLDEARDNEAAAASQLAERVRLSDRRELRDLKAQAERLLPVRPEQAGELERAAGIAEGLLARLPAHRARLQELQRSLSGGSVAATAGSADWERALLAEFVPELQDVGDPDPHVGLLADLRRRLQYARTVRDVTLLAAAEDWAAAGDAVARDPRFGGRRLAPQLGLLPLGPDPHSGLQEFAPWFWTGEVPSRDPASGELLLDERSAVVYVLVPGGCTLVGSQRSEPQAPRYVPTARDNEGPLVEVELEPFLVMKDELTQGQYLRVTGSNPSQQPRIVQPVNDRPLCMPVTSLTWEEAARFARRLGTTLPTEVQWEHAARAGTDTPWWPGIATGLLQPAINVMDRTVMLPGGWQGDASACTFDDGRESLAPAQWGAPNGFGLRNVHGNLWEFCADAYRSSLRGEFRAGDGMHLVTHEPGDSERHVLRGGSFEESLDVARSSFRSDVIVDRRTMAGIRAVRALEPEPRHD